MLETSFVAAEEIISFAVVEEPMLKGLKNVLVTLVGGVVEAADVVSVIVDVEAIDVVASDEVNIVRVSDVNSGDVDVDLLANILKIIISLLLENLFGTSAYLHSIMHNRLFIKV